MSSESTPKLTETAGLELASGSQVSLPISGSSAPFEGKNRFYVGFLLLGLVGLAAYGVDVQYKRYMEEESIEALKAAGLVINDLGESLSITDPTRKCVTDDCLAHIGDLNRPVKANFNNCQQITDAGLRNLSGNKRISMLHLSRTGVTDDGIKHLSSLVSLESLDLSQTGLSDSGLAHLSTTKLAKLQDLNIGLTQVSDAGMEHLGELEGLRFLVVEGTKVTGDGAKHLRTANPEVMVFGIK